MNVSSIPDEELLRRAVGTARASRRYSPRWLGVSDAFLLGNTYSRQLCERFGFDPDERVKR